MGSTDPLTQARYPASQDAPDIATYIQNAVNDLSDVIGGNFSTTATRDTAYTAWVAQGNTMHDNLVCRVGGYPQVYRGGAWHGTTSILYSTTSFDSTLYTIDHTVATLTVTDPGYSYKLKCGACADLGQLGAGVHARLRVQVNGTTINPGGVPAFNDTGSTVNDALTYLPTPGTSGTLTGGATVTVLISKEVGAAGNGYQVASGTGAQFNILWAEVIPA